MIAQQHHVARFERPVESAGGVGEDDGARAGGNGQCHQAHDLIGRAAFVEMVAAAKCDDAFSAERPGQRFADVSERAGRRQPAERIVTDRAERADAAQGARQTAAEHDRAGDVTAGPLAQ